MLTLIQAGEGAAVNVPSYALPGRALGARAMQCPEQTAGPSCQIPGLVWAGINNPPPPPACLLSSPPQRLHSLSMKARLVASKVLTAEANPSL